MDLMELKKLADAGISLNESPVNVVAKLNIVASVTNKYVYWLLVTVRRGWCGVQFHNNYFFIFGFYDWLRSDIKK
jgi:hypothetical protein